MQRTILLTLLVIGYVGNLAMMGRAGQDGGFAKFFTEFQAAVKAGDKEKVANMIDFNDFTWEATDALREVKTREAFLKNYDRMFTPAIKNRIATGRPKEGAKGNYTITWHTTNTEYGFDFLLQKDRSYKFLGYTVGPY
jgi:hypothetical protein